MYFWKIKDLVRDLRESRVPEGQKARYFLIFVVQYMLGYFIKEDVSVYLMFENVVVLLTTIFGFILCYETNRRGDGRDFIERVVCLNLPSVMRTLVFAVVFFIIVYMVGSKALGMVLYDKHLEKIDIIFLMVCEFFYFYLLQSNIAKAAKPN